MDRLPEDTLSKILSLTSPMEVSRFAVISKGFKSAADSDSVWDRFLLSDWPEIVSRSVSPVTYTTKKELYVTLCLSPILLDAGRLSFSLEKRSGKKCYMVGAREFWIVWADNTPQYWDWINHPDSRFSEVAKLKAVCWLQIEGGINTRLLSWKTIYGAYLVYKLHEEWPLMCSRVELANASVRFVDGKVLESEDVRLAAILSRFDLENEDQLLSRGDELKEVATVVHLQPASGSRPRRGSTPVLRDDGWMEVEMGSFWNDRGDDGNVGVRLMGVDGELWKSGLIFQGVEFRPKC